MPNTEVKPFSADGTWLETAWESMSLPVSKRKKAEPEGFVFFHIKHRGKGDEKGAALAACGRGPGPGPGQARLLPCPTPPRSRKNGMPAL